MWASSATFDNKKSAGLSPRAFDGMDGIGLIVGEKLFHAIMDDGASGDEADEGILIVHDGDEILTACALDEVVHGCGDADGDIVALAGDLGDAVRFRLAHIHIAHIFHCPEDIALRERAAVFATLIEDRERGITDDLHFFECLPNGVIII